MQLVYLSPEKITPNRAPSYQILHTVQALAAAGVPGLFVTPWPATRLQRTCRELIGIGFPDAWRIVSVGPGPDLPILSRRWPNQVWTGLSARIQRFLLDFASHNADAVVYTRSRRMAAAVPEEVHLPVIFEYHEPESIVKKEEGHDQRTVQRIRDEELCGARRADALVTVTECHARQAKQLYGIEAKPYVIRNGVDTSVFQLPSRQCVPGRLLYIGSLQAWKGLDLLARAVARVPQATLHVCGGVRQSQAWRVFAGRCQALGIQERVEMLGTLPQTELHRVAATAVAGVLPIDGRYRIAREYTSPLKLFEYLALGLPVIATDLPSVREIVAHDREAILFQDGSEAALAHSINELIADPRRIADMSQRALDASGRYTWNHRARQIIEVARQVSLTRGSRAEAA